MDLSGFVRPFNITEASYRRISPIAHKDTPLSYGLAPSRFSGPEVTTPQGREAAFGVVYMAIDLETAMAETLIRQRSAHPNMRIHRQTLRDHVLFGIKTTAALNLLDITGPRLNRLGYSLEALHDSKSYALSQELSEHAYQATPVIDGVLYPSWHSFRNNIAVYPHALSKLTCVSMNKLTSHLEVLDLLKAYKITIYD
ncbi:hypothetical protein T35B1_18808 [Salinisphaera shabanensis T35B1]|uniref:RES family NAD+ phosphorylase n=1 Tax=Salinisphaera TaxID=180541 RepID=UPI000C3DBE0B|nr:RES family NAD+ phosphorylase [Salinisphaera sp.]MBS62150.1 hypothetical protein [Salinisphaera sp.]